MQLLDELIQSLDELIQLDYAKWQELTVKVQDPIV